MFFMRSCRTNVCARDTTSGRLMQFDQEMPKNLVITLRKVEWRVCYAVRFMPLIKSGNSSLGED